MLASSHPLKINGLHPIKGDKEEWAFVIWKWFGIQNCLKKIVIQRNRYRNLNWNIMLFGSLKTTYLSKENTIMFFWKWQTLSFKGKTTWQRIDILCLLRKELDADLMLLNELIAFILAEHVIVGHILHLWFPSREDTISMFQMSSTEVLDLTYHTGHQW